MGPRVDLLVEGDVDLLTAPRLREFLTARVTGAVPGTTVSVDMAGVTLLAAAGVRVLVDVAALGRRRGVALVLSATSRPVDVILGVAGLSPQLQDLPDPPAPVRRAGRIDA